EEALKKVSKVKFIKKIEIEVTSQDEAVKAAELGADIIMLDNMTPQQVKKISTKLKKLRPEIIIEVSGGITPDNIEAYVPYADVISMGWLTHSAPATDFSLDVI
ncbi:MAG: nicotinate-nucleotide diphosphorylase (carboxylating), partial [Thermoplasmata archaeon]|nr:nicotinate-nucleotide diphosphorylase (carboxylating) [Thermoplasmata archaeon]